MHPSRGSAPSCAIRFPSCPHLPQALARQQQGIGEHEKDSQPPQAARALEPGRHSSSRLAPCCLPLQPLPQLWSLACGRVAFNPLGRPGNVAPAHRAWPPRASSTALAPPELLCHSGSHEQALVLISMTTGTGLLRHRAWAQRRADPAAQVGAVCIGAQRSSSVV